MGFLSSMFDVLCICILELERGGKVIENSGLEPLGSLDVQHRILHLVMWAVLRSIANFWESQQGCPIKSDL